MNIPLLKNMTHDELESHLYVNAPGSLALHVITVQLEEADALAEGEEDE